MSAHSSIRSLPAGCPPIETSVEAGTAAAAAAAAAAVSGRIPAAVVI